MGKKEKKALKNYPFIAAGRTWTFTEIMLDINPDGTTVVPGREIDRMNFSVANELCGALAPLKAEEMEFLCLVTTTSGSDIADVLGVAKSSVTHWKKPGQGVPLAASLRLKRWFWSKIFSCKIGPEIDHVPTRVIIDENEFLKFLRDIAVRRGLATSLTKRAG
jgi:hypothetical protein